VNSAIIGTNQRLVCHRKHNALTMYYINLSFQCQFTGRVQTRSTRDKL